MAVPKQHRSKSRQGQRRMHIFAKVPALTACKKCGKSVLPHTVCENCGTYREKQYIDILAKLSKKERKAKEKELQEQAAAPQNTETLTPEQLSKNG
jgi:large subunit ribosomal protein L32